MTEQIAIQKGERHGRPDFAKIGSAFRQEWRVRPITNGWD